VLFDSHAHYDDPQFDSDRHSLLEAMRDANVSNILCCASSLSSAKACIALSEQYDFVYASAGVHPHVAKDFSPDDGVQFRSLLAHPKCIAVGEMGLDYNRNFSPREIQQKVFSYQLSLATVMDMPIIVHDRDAHADTLSMLKNARCRGVVHCYSGSAEMAVQLVDLGYYISFPGVITFPNARRSHDVIRAIPIERLLIETDAPYLSPVPHRGKRNDSRYLKHTCAALADILGMSYAEAAALTSDNARRCFGLEA